MADAETDAKPVDQDALVADIDRTRAELARTIDAIKQLGWVPSSSSITTIQSLQSSVHRHQHSHD